MSAKNPGYLTARKLMPEVTCQIDAVVDFARKKFRAGEIDITVMQGLATHFSNGHALIMFELALREDEDAGQVPA